MVFSVVGNSTLSESLLPCIKKKKSESIVTLAVTIGLHLSGFCT